MVSRAKLYDLLCASPMIALLALVALGFVLKIRAEIGTGAPGLVADIAAKTVFALFAAIQVVLFCVRELPVVKAQGWAPRAAALVGANTALLLLLLPMAHPEGALSVISAICAVGGTAAGCFVLLWLGRGFSILPQARKFVVSGPYRVVRHPLYLAELIALFGAMWQYRQPWSFAIFALTTAAQFPRMDFEEAILADAYPGYRAYAIRTARLFPGLY
ncbi:MAG TPA: isoprenylcysteine carboxylmethyltransferase family protein [Rhizomicrobium sp.]|jgi:protein-S-isoprenylcysteine O-methyltransferase Ste14